MLLLVSLLLLTPVMDFIYLCCYPPDCYYCSSCEVLLLLLASLLNVVGFPTAAAVIPDVNGVLLQASLIYCFGGPVVAFIPTVAGVLAVVSSHAIVVIFWLT